MKSLKIFNNVLMMLSVVLILTSCSQQNPGVNTLNQNSNSTTAQDYVIVSNAIVATADDAALAADQTNSVLRGTLGICGARAVDTSHGQTVVIYYDSSSVCGGVSRTGIVTVTLTDSAGWAVKGGAINVSVTNVVINDPVTSQQYTLNGTFTVINESGGVLSSLSNGNGPVVRRHQSAATLQVSFNGSTTSWTFDRTRSWTNLNVGSNKLLNVSQHSEAVNGVECTGIDRFGRVFSNVIDSVILTDTYLCTPATSPLMEPYAGMITQSVGGLNSTIQYGCNLAGTHTGTTQSCPSGFTYGYYITAVSISSNVPYYLFGAYYL